jgi:L-threonylcarbamoyladenylate synthase
MLDTPPIATRLLPANPSTIAEAGALLRAGRLVAFPTETVYGLGANAFDDRAVAAIFAAKGRPRFNPLIVHVQGIAEAKLLAMFHPLAEKLAGEFWPGGLTLVLPRREPSRLSLLACAGLDTVALRAPSHTIARALLKEARVPVAAPSANRSGRISPTTADAAMEELRGRVDAILDGGPCALGLESTIIGFQGEQAVLLRKGAIAREAIETMTGPLAAPRSDAIEAPGMMASHYAPHTPLRLNATDVEPGEALLAFGAAVPQGARMICNLSQNSDLTEAAANLFAMLRNLDKSGAARIAVMPVPDKGLGEAINDRLARAAAPRAKDAP